MYISITIYTIICAHFSCDHGVSRELLGGTDVEKLESLPECPLGSEKQCNLSETKGIEVPVYMYVSEDLLNVHNTTIGCHTIAVILNVDLNGYVYSVFFPNLHPLDELTATV